MSTSVSLQELSAALPLRPVEKSVDAAVSSTAISAQESEAANVAATPEQIDAAVEQLRSHLSAQRGNSEFSVDYLSGLDVVTLRAAESGDVIFQMPSTVAVNLARLIKEGASLSSLGLLDTKG